jgi:WD40 repeat protein
MEHQDQTYIGTRLSGGHTQTVLSIAATTAPTVRIITGGEQGEVAVWSVGGQNIKKFHIDDDAEDDVTSIVCSSVSPEVFYAACGVKICSFDLRQLDRPVAIYNFNEEEISEIALNEKENFLAAADDSSNIKVINLTDGKLYKTLRKHSNICSAVKFRPHRPWELLSGGYDNKLIQWDFAKSRAHCIIDMQEIGVTPEELDSYVVSPPFVHSIAVSSTGSAVAVGTENAVVHIFDASKRTLEYRQTLRGHRLGVGQVHFPQFSDDQFLLSGANDMRLCFWKLGADLEQHCTALTNGCSGSAEAHSSAVSSSHQPYATILHTEKINWLTTCATVHGRFVAVADSTSNPIIYPYLE